MQFTVTYDSETECILVSIEGELRLSLFDLMAKQVADYMAKHPDCKFILNDLTNAIPTKSNIETYYMPKRALKAGVDRSMKRALVVNGDLSNFKFLETVFVNQGNIVKLFNNIKDAKEWLFASKEF
ncbi:hypothetical protein KAJ27_20770 [bacterium]|nr:hypothetical protein [bacterium]